MIDNKNILTKPIPVGQMNFPSWERFENAFKGIFNREYYTNHGPLLAELESKLEKFLKVKNVVCVTNGTIALIIAAKALGLSGKVIVPSFSFIATAQSLTWAGLEPVFCDVDPTTHHIKADLAEKLIDSNVSAILAVNLWGNSCAVEDLQNLANTKKIKLYFDSAHGFGCERNGTSLACLGEASIFSFHATKILNAAEGGCVCTNDDELAEKIRNIRSSYGVRKQVDIPFTGNGRMSEAQAAMALLSLEDYKFNQNRNREYYNLYCKLLSEIKGIKIYQPDSNGLSNYQYVVCQLNEKEFGVSRDNLVNYLRSKNILTRRYFTPGMHRTIPYCNDFPQYLNACPNTDKLCASVFQLPSGQDVTPEIIKIICDIIINFYKNSQSCSK
ncbi:MAG: aminotransferase class I/II-fold pyridoxal phosphate-dependent enzyme [Rickettsiales bacterium]|nr:aminotransferase class I/II-fold pyridoxal phosphate-dependent enzyme [Rickettsiales bacterium]